MAAKFQEYKDNLERNLNDKSKPWTKYFEKAEQKTGVDRLHLFIGLVAFTGLYLVFGFGAELICNLIGFVYPAYMSMKALESPLKDDDTKWLTYWVVFACFSCVEYFSDFIVGWFPLYWLIKCIFIIWCYLPTDYNGSLIIYHRIIRPYYQKHQGSIDNMANSAPNIIGRINEHHYVPSCSRAPQRPQVENNMNKSNCKMCCQRIIQNSKIEEIRRTQVENNKNICQIGCRIIHDSKIEEIRRKLVENNKNICQMGCQRIIDDSKIEEIRRKQVENNQNICQMGCQRIINDSKIEEIRRKQVENNKNICQMGCQRNIQDSENEEILEEEKNVR